MLGKRPRPMISKLSALLVSGNRAGFLDVGSSPRSPFELKIQSPRSLKHYDVGGVGLGIVAALDHGGGCENLTKFSVCSSSVNRSSPIPVSSGKNCERCIRGGDFEEMESLEDYTYVTCHAGPNKTSTKVYYDGVDQTNTKKNGFHNNNKKSPKTRTFVDDFSAYPTSDFLSSCHLCSKKLHGKDIYMYRGEKAFCSTECRSRQIMMDERKEQQCRSDVSRSADVSSSPYTRDQIFSAGILAI